MEKFPGFTTLRIVGEIQNMMTEMKCEPEQFKGRIIFMSNCESVVIPTEIPNANAISQSSTSLAQEGLVAKIRTESRRTS